ncbi:efflux RND transporter periplasmic adaptor subunit, partial [Sulfitobacter sp. 1A12779]|uniref:efflux RND transporter periplasmic adaptor subunit n=1 Tax=Sulfitobacter sp. 1A12779 TaxID=3368599 RepID=UPI00374528BB
MKPTTMTMAALTVGVLALVPITGATGNAETPLPMTAAAAVAPQDDDHAGEAADAHGDDDHADEAKEAHDDDDHAGEAKDAHDDDDHAGEAKDAHGDDDHAGEAEGAHGDEGGGDVVKLAPEVAKEAGILLEQAELGALGESLSLPAEIRFDADRMANVTPKVSGVIDRLLVGEGDTVAYGDTLALITSRELAGLKSQWIIAQTNEVLAAQALERLEGLWARKVTSEANVQTARAEHESAKTESEAAETELHAVGIDHAALEKIATAP